MTQKDVIIVGAGPAGSSCAGYLKKAGVDCILMDKQTFPRNKPCAGWITPGVLKDLHFNPNQYPNSFTTFNSFQISIKGIHFTLPTRQFAIRRIEFDAWLIKQAGVPVIQHQVRQIARKDGGYMIDDEYFARYLVGAGGSYCPVRKMLLNLSPSYLQQDQIGAMEEEFHYPYTDSRCHLWFLENGLPGYSWYVPKTGGSVNVGIGGKSSVLRSKGDSILHHWKIFTEQLEKIGLVKNHLYQPQAHTYYLRRSLDHLRAENAFLVGDSAGLATPDMGEGIGASIRSGIAAGKAIYTGKEYDLSSIPRYSIWSILSGR